MGSTGNMQWLNKLSVITDCCYRLLMGCEGTRIGQIIAELRELVHGKLLFFFVLTLRQKLNLENSVTLYSFRRKCSS